MHHSSMVAAMQASSAQQLRPLCEDALAALCDSRPEISLALIATADARLLSSRTPAGMDAHRLAAMTSSLLALGETLSRELSGGGCQSAMLSMHNYTCAVVHIPRAHQSLVLAVGVRQTIMPALARRMALDLAEKISLALDALEAGTPD
ncbi:roadblock/LC7 domain-containing protein [Dyella acidiphila]|uniref:Roadblock/LC7 domain-containing protein n=1 Tax=Dyella acidiphila TaxID=2775866 RepID=A0ABR9GCU3_9GAMM|nr:roadblock/LC7 domain-containing protein [Dyella acidiphila]MBE1161865.1 roadblock/LC7 domain-containing protein [Dyella acidiphila]